MEMRCGFPGCNNVIKNGVLYRNMLHGYCDKCQWRGTTLDIDTKTPTPSCSSGVSGYDASDTQKLEAVRSVVEKHRNAISEPYLISGGAREVLKAFFEDISRVVE